MKLDKPTFDTLCNLKKIDFSSASDAQKSQAIASATAWLTAMHTIESIEYVKNIAGAMGAFEGTMTRVIKSCGGDVPKYKAHPSALAAFLALELPMVPIPLPPVPAEEGAEEAAAAEASVFDEMATKLAGML